MAGKIPLNRAAQLHPFIDFLDRIGTPVESGLERHKLTPHLRHAPNMFISTRAMSAFIGDMALREGIEDFGWRVTSSRLEQIPYLNRKIQSSPTLLHTLKTICALGYRESSNLQIWLEERGDELFFCYRGSLEVGAEGADELAKMRTGLVTAVVRMFTAPDWVPSEYGLDVAGEIGEAVREDLRDARIIRAPDWGWVRLHRSILARLPRTRVPVEKGSAREDDDEPALDLVGSLVQLLAPYPAEATPSLHDAADMAGISVRTLQRDLARAGSSYRDVSQRVKLDKARELLKQRDVRILEVAYTLGFSNAANFSRFFKGLMGMTPREYRTTLTNKYD